MNAISVDKKVLIFQIFLYVSLFCEVALRVLSFLFVDLGNSEESLGDFLWDIRSFFLLYFLIVSFLVVAWYFMSFPGIFKRIGFLNNIIFVIVFVGFVLVVFGESVMGLGGDAFVVVFVFFVCLAMCHLGQIGGGKGKGKRGSGLID